MKLNTALALGLVLATSPLLLASAQAQTPAGEPDVAAQTIARVDTLSKAQQFAAAQALLEVELKGAREAGEQKALRIALADVHFAWAQSLQASSRLDEAITHFQAALEIDRELRPSNAATDLFRIGVAHLNAQRFEDALKYLQPALALTRELKDKPAEAWVLNNIGMVLAGLNRHAEGLQALEQALVVAREARDRPSEAASLSNIGWAHLFSRSDDALKYLQQALTLQHEQKDKPGQASALQSLGLANSFLARHKEALEYYQQALPILRDIKDRPGEASALGGIGGANLLLGRHMEALKSYHQALPILREQKDRHGEANTLSIMGGAYRSLGRYPEALHHYHAALPIQRAVKDSPGEASTLGHIGSALSSLSRYQEALPYYQQALSLQRAIKDRRAEATTLGNIGVAYVNLSGYKGRYEEALKYYQQALPILREVNDRRGEATTLSNIGGVYRSQNRFEEALKYLQQALPIRREVKDRAGEASALGIIGGLYSSLGRHEEALKYKLESLPILREEKNLRDEAITLSNIGVAYNSLSRYKEALRYFQQALPLQRAIKDRRAEATTLSNIGGDYLDLGRYEEALKSYQAALAIHREVKDRAGEAIALNNIGRVHRDPAKSLRYYQAALLIRREVKDRGGEAATLNNIGDAYNRLGRHQQALKYLQQALPISREVRDRQGQASVLNNMGWAYNSLGRYEQASRHYQQALPIQREIKERAGEANTLNNLMYLWKARNKPRLAIFYGKQSVNALQSIRGGIQGLDKETQRGFVRSRENAYRQLADLLITQGRLAEAQQVLGMLKEEEFFQFVRRDATQAQADSRATLNGQEEAWEKRYEEIAARVTQIGAEYGALGALEQRNEAQEKRMDELKLDLDVAERGFGRFLTQLQAEFESHRQTRAQVINLPQMKSLQETLRKIGGGVAILSTIVGPDDFHVILMTADTVQAFKNPRPVPAELLRRKVLGFREAIKSRQDPRPTAQELYKVVFCQGAVEKALQGAKIKTLMWSLDDVLRYAPMSALHDGDKYLVESYAQTVFTLASLSRLQEQPSKSWKALGLGVSKPHPNFSALPGVVAEMKAIIHAPQEKGGSSPESVLGAAQGVLPGTVALDEAFTLQALERGLRARPQMVHIASHFKFKPGDETDSFLLLGEGTLSLDKLMLLRFSGVDLLTLSACDTAMGSKGADGREVESFAEQAQVHGAGAVLASLWPLADASTPLLMRLFYSERERDGGTTKAQALQSAQLALLRGGASGQVLGGAAVERGSRNDEAMAGAPTNAGAPFAHPYFWAPFVLIGNWR